jgi:hypothetical protein
MQSTAIVIMGQLPKNGKSQTRASSQKREKPVATEPVASGFA